jgi:hypothetical protein
MNSLAKTQNDTHEKCMNGPFFHEAYSPGMYELAITHDFYPNLSSFSPIFREKTQMDSRSEKFVPPSPNNPDFP